MNPTAMARSRWSRSEASGALSGRGLEASSPSHSASSTTNSRRGPARSVPHSADRDQPGGCKGHEPAEGESGVHLLTPEEGDDRPARALVEHAQEEAAPAPSSASAGRGDSANSLASKTPARVSASIATTTRATSERTSPSKALKVGALVSRPPTWEGRSSEYQSRNIDRMKTTAATAAIAAGLSASELAFGFHTNCDRPGWPHRRDGDPG